MRIIGLSGSNGAGKDSVGQILQDEHGFLFLSVTESLREEARKRGLSVDRENLRMISAEWRREHGLGVLVDRVIEQYQAMGGDQKFSRIALASLRNSGEAARVHELGGEVVWVDADPEVRYQRVTSVDRGRAEEDNKTFEEFLSEEQAEMDNSEDIAALDMANVKNSADIIIENNAGFEELSAEIQAKIIEGHKKPD